MEKKPMSTKTLAKTEKMCYNTFWVPVFRLYRSALFTSMQGRRTCYTAACLFLYYHYTAIGEFCQWVFGFCVGVFVSSIGERNKRQNPKTVFTEIFLVFLTGIVASSRVQHRVSLRLDHGEPFFCPPLINTLLVSSKRAYRTADTPCAESEQGARRGRP